MATHGFHSLKLYMFAHRFSCILICWHKSILYSLKTESRDDANFVVTGGYQWRQIGIVTNCWFSVVGIIDTMINEIQNEPLSFALFGKKIIHSFDDFFVVKPKRQLNRLTGEIRCHSTIKHFGNQYTGFHTTLSVERKQVKVTQFPFIFGLMRVLPFS